VSREKDLDMLAATARGLRAENVRCAIVGDGPYAKDLCAALPEAIFTGTLTGIDLARAYASADVFAFPSTTDTFGNVVLEALASGLPCVVSDQGGPRELIRHGATGLITRALDAESFTAACRNLATDVKLRQRMSLTARASVEDRDWSAAFAKFWAISADSD
jgi:glycosyltransferase involved in cell wall biosynthesis